MTELVADQNQKDWSSIAEMLRGDVRLYTYGRKWKKTKTSFYQNAYLAYLWRVRDTSVKLQLREGGTYLARFIVCIDVYMVLLVAPVGIYLEALGMRD